jgi:hypothetical protein
VNRYHYQRGQTLPVWAFGTLTVLLLLAFSLSYGNMLRWQLRAQNAADSAARGLLSIQATQWNEMESTLQASAVEEYRIRAILQAMLLTVHGNGGCMPVGLGPASCDQIYASERAQYLNSVARYTNDVTILHRLVQPTFANQVSAVQNALAIYQKNCGLPNGGDCAFDYTLVAAQPRADKYLEDVWADCCDFTVGGGTVANPALTSNFWPMEIEVVACAKVPSLFPAFFSFNAPTYDAIGRAAATTLMATQEFMYPGTIVNPQTGQPFQPVEHPESFTNSNVLAGGPNPDLWYQVDFGGNPATSNGKATFTYNPGNTGLMTAVGWWSSIPINPFSGTLIAGTNFQCK